MSQSKQSQHTDFVAFTVYIHAANDFSVETFRVLHYPSCRRIFRHLLVIASTRRDLNSSMKFYFALFHLNKCYHHRLDWKKFMKTKNSVPICLRSKVQLTGTNMWENLFSPLGARETSFPYSG